MGLRLTPAASPGIAERPGADSNEIGPLERGEELVRAIIVGGICLMAVTVACDQAANPAPAPPLGEDSLASGHPGSRLENETYAKPSDIQTARKLVGGLPPACSGTAIFVNREGMVTIAVSCEDSFKSMRGLIKIKDGIVRDVRDVPPHETSGALPEDAHAAAVTPSSEDPGLVQKKRPVDPRVLESLKRRQRLGLLTSTLPEYIPLVALLHRERFE